MSLHQLANHISAQGRGPDSNLVHMSPRELSGLQSLAMAHGGTLTINPETGLPEAGFLDSILPTLLGGAATFFSGGTITPFMAALGVGGLTALTSKDLGKGLMAGLGAYGGAGIAGGLMNFGEAAIGAEAAKGALPSGINPVGADAVDYEAGQAAAEKTARAGASNFDKLSRGVTEGFKNPMGAFSAIGGGSKLQGAAMLGAPLLSALSSQDQTSVPTAEQIRFDPSYANINIRRDQLPYQPDTGRSAQRGYFGPTYVNRNAAEGGFVSDAGIEHFAAGGIPLDPDYDYSGYGRKKTNVVRPVTPMPDVPKPDFLAADGKTYRYDPIKKRWYVIKEAEAKTNAGVATLMDIGGPGGNNGAGSGSSALPGYGAYGNQGSLAAILSNIGLTSAGQAVATNLGNQLNPGLTLTGADISGGQFTAPHDVTNAAADRQAADRQAASDARENARGGISGLTPSSGTLDNLGDRPQSNPTASLPSLGYTGTPLGLLGDILGGSAVSLDTAPVETREATPNPAYAQALADAQAASIEQAESFAVAQAFAAAQAQAATDQAAQDAATSKSSPTATGGIASLGPAPAAPASAPASAPAAAPASASAPASAPAPAPAATTETAQFYGAAAVDGLTREDRDAIEAAKMATENALIDAAQKEAADKAAAFSAALAEANAAQAAQAAQAQAAQAQAAQAAQAQATADQAARDAAAADIGGGGTGSGDGNSGGEGGGGYGPQAKGGMVGRYAQGGLGSLGGYSDGGRLLRGPGDGVSDSIPATVGDRQPARLADGEFVVPARIVSELGNGSTEAGARALYKMMDRIQANRRKTTGKNSVAVNSKSHKYLPA